MQAVILAGGLGTRLRPLTWTRPKPLLPIVNVPLVERVIAQLPADVRDVILTVSYRADDLRAHFRDGLPGRNVAVVEESEPLGTAGALANVAQHLGESFFVLNGDTLGALDLAEMRRAHERRRPAATIAVRTVPDPRHYGVVALDGERIVGFVEKPETIDEAPSRLANAGTYILERAALDAIPEGPASLERDVFPGLIGRGRALEAFRFEGIWVDAGRRETFLHANALVLAESGLHAALAPGARNDGARLADWVVAGPRTVLGAGSEIARAVLFSSATVGRRAVVRDSVLGEGVVVGEDAVLVDCLVGDNAHISDGVFLKNVKVEPGETVGESYG